jgi:hypothetical protein
MATHGARRRTPGLLGYLLVVSVLAGCTSHADRVVDVDPAHAKSVTLAGTTVSLPQGSVAGPGRLTIRTADNPAPGLIDPAGLFTDVTLDGTTLVGSARIDLPLDPGDGTPVAVYRSADDTWGLPDSTLSDDGRSMAVTTPHFTLFGTIRVKADAIMQSAVDFVKRHVTGRAQAPQPTCADEATARAQGVAITSDSGDAVRWCLGMAGGKRVLQAVNNRNFPVIVTYPAVWSRSDVAGSGPSLESFGRWLDTQVPPPRGSADVVIAGGESVALTLSNPAVGGSVSVDMSSAGFLMGIADSGIDALLAVVGGDIRLKAKSGTAVASDVLRQHNIEGLTCITKEASKLGDLRGKSTTTDFADVAKFAVTCGAEIFVIWLEDQHVKGPALVLAKAAATVVSAVTLAGALLTSLTSGLREAWDTAFGEATYRIKVQVTRDLTATDLLNAPVPGMCRHSAGRLSNGSLPGLGATEGFEYISAGQPAPFSSEPTLKPLLADLTADGRTDALTSANCSAGGVSWPNVLLLYSAGPTLLGSLDLSTVYSAEHAEVSSISAQGGDALVSWKTYDGCCFDPRSWTGTVHWDGHQLRMIGAHQT